MTKVRFHHNAPYLISIGGLDKAIFQWKYDLDGEANEESITTKDTEGDVEEEWKNQNDEGGDDMFEEEETG